MAIYTKKGDKGETKVFDKGSGSLIGISKKSCRIKAIGTIDELNSFFGIVISEMGNGKSESGNLKLKAYSKSIREIQKNLFVINSMLAGSNLRFSKIKIKKLEREIDKWEGSMPVLKNFIFYSGSKEASLIFYARALCRRAERSLVALSKVRPVNPAIMVYFNRLSDYLFMFARSINFENKVKEEYWIGRKK